MRIVLFSLLGFFLILALSIILKNFNLFNDFIYFENIFFQKGPVLAIGILSARENFLQRKLLRSTFLQEYVNNSYNSTKAWFILGNSSCSIAPEYRINKYGCEKWNINISGLDANIFSVKKESFETSQPVKIAFQGFTFKINHPIIINKLGIFSDVIFSKEKAKVAIIDVQTKELIVETTFSSNRSTFHHGYIYSPIENILFPKEYEGLILFEGYLQHSNCSNLIWNNGGGAITYKRLYPTPNHLDSINYFYGACSAVSMEFFIHELDVLKTVAGNEYSITENWKLHVKEIEKKITHEKEMYKDLVIVNTLDVYRNLPKKLLKFYKWLKINQQFQYFMKSDDDSILNIKLLFKKLKENSKFNPYSTWLWSRFRKDWPVNYIGKWADYEYKSAFYPSFPCGAAYVMSRQTVLWLAENSEILHSYQGEDVSLGIWLAAINPELIEDEHFECGSSCSTNSYNRGQLNIDQIQKAWSFYEKCLSLCTC